MSLAEHHRARRRRRQEHLRRLRDGAHRQPARPRQDLGPGERAQPIHADDQLIPLPKPHVSIICNSMWALTDFTKDNGATRIVPGSHLLPSSPELGREYETSP